MAWVKIAWLARGTVTWLILAAIASLVPAEVVVFVLALGLVGLPL